MSLIYEPAEDSFLFQDYLKKFLKDNSINSHLDMGTGSGILADTSSKIIGGNSVTAADINEDAVKKLKDKDYNAIHSNLFKNIKGSFDLITFNAPYLPEDPREPKDSRLATTGGKKGDEISVKFLKEAKLRLNKGGTILLLISSLTPMDKIGKFNPEIVKKKKIFQEELLILKFNDVN